MVGELVQAILHVLWEAFILLVSFSHGGSFLSFGFFLNRLDHLLRSLAVELTHHLFRWAECLGR